MDESIESLRARLQALEMKFAARTAAVPPAPVVDGAAVEFDADSQARKLAVEIYHDIFVLGSLGHQRERLGDFGRLLKRPLPLSSVDAPAGTPVVLASELLAYEGEYRSFADALATTGGSREQLYNVVAVTQASGSGKTKLAYAAGMDSSLVVLVRITKQDGSLLPAWRTYMDLAARLNTAAALATPPSQRSIARTALSGLRLLVASHVDWVRRVLAAFDALLTRDDASEEAAVGSSTADAPPAAHPMAVTRAAALREAALRCLRNGRGDTAVGKLYAQRLQAAEAAAASGAAPAAGAGAASSVSGTSNVSTVPSLNHAATERAVAEVDAALRALLWRDACVVVFYDEAQALLPKQDDVKAPRIFMRLSDYNRPVESETPVELQDVFYGLTVVMRSLTDGPTYWRQVLCGPWLELSERVKLPEYSCVHERIQTVHHASFITKADMVNSLGRYFDLEALPPSVLAGLRKLTGRPKWFFDTFWQALRATALAKLWGAPEVAALPSSDDALSRSIAAAAPPSSGDALIGYIAAAAQAAARRTSAVAQQMVEQAWSDTAEGATRRSMYTLCRELYVATKLHGGVVTLNGTVAAHDAIRLGLLALQPSARPVAVQLHDEPCIGAALEAHGDSIVREHSLADDPVFQLLARALEDGQVAGFELTTSTKGPRLELAFAWHILRTTIRGNGNASLWTVLAPFLDKDLVPDAVRERLQRCVVTAQRASKPAAPPGTDFQQLLGADAADVVLFGISTLAGADVAFPVLDDAVEAGAGVAGAGGASRILVLVQAKAQKDTSLVECLRAATPAWQYVSDTERRAALEGRWDRATRRTAARQPYESLVADFSDAFANALRVALCVNEFRPESHAVCRVVNSDAACAQSPVVLCSVLGGSADGRSGFPSAVVAGLRASCESPGAEGVRRVRPVQHTAPSNFVYWVPHTVATVTAALRGPGSVLVPGPSEELKDAMSRAENGRHEDGAN